MIQLLFHIKIYLLGWQYSEWWIQGTVKQRSRTQCEAESGVSHFHLSPSITLKDVGSQHGRIRGFTQEPPVVEVSLNLQEDKISTKERTNKKHLKNTSGCLTGPLVRMLMIFINTPSRSHSYISQWEHSRIKTIRKGIAGAARQQTWYTSNAGEFTFPMGVLNISFWFSWKEGFVFGRKRRIGRPWGRSCYWYCASLKASSLVSDSPNQSAPRAFGFTLRPEANTTLTTIIIIIITIVVRG